MKERRSGSGFGRHLHHQWRQWALSVGLCALLLTATNQAAAQNRNAGEIKGTVMDISGGVVPNVEVTAKNTDTGQVTKGTTNSDGIYDLPFVPTGPYSVTFTKEGYEKTSQNNIVLHVEAITLDVKLKVGAVSTEVQVDAANSVLLQTEDAEVNLTLSPEALTELPNVGGDWKYMTSLLPGVSPGRYENGTGGGLASTYYVSINGAQADQYSVQLDGGVSASIRSVDPGPTEPPLDGIAELNVSTALFGAESGNGTATFNVITKSGTNRFHGSAWEGIQNDAFEAKGFEQPGKIPTLRWNMFGFTAGGPFIKNRLFFFESYQRNPITYPGSGFYTVPEDSVRGIGNPNGDAVFDPAIYGIIYDPATETIVDGVKTRQPFPNNTIPAARFDPAAVAMMQYYPRSNESFSNGNNYIFSASAPVLNQLHNARVDYDFTSKNRLSGSWNWAVTSYVNPYPAQSPNYFDYRQGSNNIVAQLTDAWTISPSMLNELRFSAFHQDSSWSTPDTKVNSKLGLTNAPVDVFPHLAIYGGPRTPYGLNGDLFALIRDGAYSLADSFTWVKGKHSLKFGGEWNKATDDFAWNQLNAGQFNFSGVATLNPNLNIATGAANPVGGSGLADFLLGEAVSYGDTLPVIPRLEIINFQAYAQDSYKVLPNLTVNLGLRFLYQGGFTQDKGLFSNFQPTLINPADNTPGAMAFGSVSLGHDLEKGKMLAQPRIGASWSFLPNWTLRGGFGMYNIPWTANNYAGNAGNGYSAFASVIPPTNSYEPALLLRNGYPSLTYPSAKTLTPDSFNGSGVGYQPYDQPISFLYEYQFGAQHMIHGFLFDLAYVGTKGSNIAFTSDYTQIHKDQLGASTHPFNNFANVNYELLNGASNYNGMQFQTKKQFKSGFTYQATYTWAKSLDTGTGQGGIGAGSVDIYQYSYDPMANYGPSNSDIRHNLSGSALYQLPFGKNKRFLNRGGLADQVLGGWEISTTFSTHSGIPLTATVGDTDASGRYSGGSWFANKVGNGHLSNRNQHAWFNINDFKVPDSNHLGVQERNTIYAPGFYQVDLSAGKKFRIPLLGEGASFEFKVDAFNALNHPNLGLPITAIYSDPVVAANAGSGSIPGGIGNPSGAGSGTDMRALQFNGHFRF